jgi:signal transduction histidine kinase/CheY-like chemotaxis protein
MSERIPDPLPLDIAMARCFHSVDRGVFVTDDRFVVRGWNHWLAAETRLSEREVIGHSLFDLYPELVDRGIDQHYRDALAGAVRVLSERLHKHLLPVTRDWHGAGTTEMSQAARIEPLHDDGRIVGTITIVEDVTERVLTERELRAQIAASDQARRVAEEASRLKDEFLATLSHEIRTPLNAVIGWSRILRTEQSTRARLHALDVIERNAMSQLRIVEDLLNMARAITGKLQLKVGQVSFESVIRAELDVVAAGAKAKQIEIETDFAQALPPVHGDPDRLQQAVWNLLANAVKFTEAGGKISVELAPDGDNVRCTVRDTGRGISGDFLPHVFDRFRQADGTASRRYGGLGLGLAIVRQIVELHGGTVGVESGGIGRGSSFWLSIPAATDRVSQPCCAPPASESATLEGVTVLVVDDDRDGLEMIIALLAQYGAAVYTAGSSEEGLELLRSRSVEPDVLVSDIGMPGADGYGFLRQVRSLPWDLARRLPAIALTGQAKPEDRLRALVAGYQRHMAKPVNAYVLATAIADLVRSPLKSQRSQRSR